jgi:hypothetical protein
VAKEKNNRLLPSIIMSCYSRGVVNFNYRLILAGILWHIQPITHSSLCQE